MVAKSTKPEIKTSFGLECRSPKEKENTRPIRENGASMCDFGQQASPKDGVVGIVSHIVAEHEIHAQNAESAGSDITGAFARENLCLRLFGGGAGTRTRVQKRVRKSVYEHILHFNLGPSVSCRRDTSAPVRKVVLVS